MCHAITALKLNIKQLAVEATGVELNAMKIADNTEITKAGVELEATEEIKPCWTKPSPSNNIMCSSSFLSHP